MTITEVTITQNKTLKPAKSGDHFGEAKSYL